MRNWQTKTLKKIKGGGKIMLKDINVLEVTYFILVLFGVYCAGLYAIQKMCNISAQEAKALLWGKIKDGLPGARLNLPVAEETVAEILDTIVQFSAITRKNTVLAYNNYSEPPSLRIEIMDSGFMEHWAVIEGNIYRSFGKLFSYSGVDGLVYVTYERTLTENLYRVTAYWATTPRSKKALEKMRGNIMEYNRRMDMEKSAPFVDRDLETEMEGVEDGRKHQAGI